MHPDFFSGKHRWPHRQLIPIEESPDVVGAIRPPWLPRSMTKTISAPNDKPISHGGRARDASRGFDGVQLQAGLLPDQPVPLIATNARTDAYVARPKTGRGCLFEVLDAIADVSYSEGSASRPDRRGLESR